MWFKNALRVLAALRHDDRGEVVPTAIIYAVAAVIAVALLAAASDYVYGWIGIWPDAAAPAAPAP
jgi:Flp pilus assembly pilin Flp